jgi:hypothetical protein
MGGTQGACDLNHELAAAANMCFLFDPNGSSHIAFGGANIPTELSSWKDCLASVRCAPAAAI